MMVTMYPVLLRLWGEPSGAAAVIATGHLMDVGPRASILPHCKDLEYACAKLFCRLSVASLFLVAIMTAIVHFFWQKYRIEWRKPKAIDACEVFQRRQ